MIFNRLFAPGAAASAGPRAGSILDTLPDAVNNLKRRLGNPDRARLAMFLEDVRDVERRIQSIERRNSPRRKEGDTGPGGAAPGAVPDSFDEHVALMFDLQVLAFAADITRVTTFKMGADRSARVYPESGVTTPFHTLSHHRETPEKIDEFARLNRYHVTKVANFLHRLRSTPDGDGNLLDHSLILYGSPMGDSHIHEHRYLPLFLAGRANGKLKGNWHAELKEDTPMANVLLTIGRKLGVDLNRIGDSTGEIEI